MIRHHPFSYRDERIYMAPFLRESLSLRDNAGRYRCSIKLTRSEISCILSYLANCFLISLIAFIILYYTYDAIINK